MKRPPPELSETAKNISAAIFFYNPTTFYDIQTWCRRKVVPRVFFNTTFNLVNSATKGALKENA